MPELMLKWKKAVFISEAFMVSSWLLFTLRFARANYWGTISRFSKFLVFVSPMFLLFSVVVPVEHFFYSPEFEREKLLFLDHAGYSFNLLLLFYSIISIINFEETLRSSSGSNRWNIKYTVIGIGGILAVNIFYYSHALLYRSIDMTLLPVRTGISLIAVMLIGFSLLRHNVMDVEVTVSRKMLFKSLSVFIIGFYLLGLGVVGEGMRYFGPEFGKNITTFLGFVGAILVLIIILSEQLRRKAIVFIDKNFFSQKYDYRDQWLQFTQRTFLKHSFEDLLGSIAEGFKEAIGVKGAAVWLKENEGGEYLCVKAVDTVNAETRPNDEIIKFLKSSRWILNIYDVNCREIVANNVDFIEKAQASLIVPLLSVDELIGFIVLGEGLAGNEYNYEDYDLLKTLAKQAAVAIINMRLTEDLTEAKEMEAMGRLSSFIIHDLKNAASMLSLITQNAEDHIDNPDFQRDSIRAISHTSGNIKSIIGKLKNLSGKTTLDFEDDDLGTYVKTAVRELDLNGNTMLSYKEMEPVKARFDKEEIIKVIINLIINAFDATAMRGKVEVVVGKEDNMAFVKVSDNGCGMSREFIEKSLFKPFQTTKKKGLGIGLYQCKTIVDAHSGRLKVVSEEGEGTDFIVYLPIVPH
jgi:putative PEP-CTERM system histidine kinase